MTQAKFVQTIGRGRRPPHSVVYVDQRTPWFPPDVHPARPGVYERDYGSSIKYSRWDGTTWLYGFRTIQAAAACKAASHAQSLDWRGLAKERNA